MSEIIDVNKATVPEYQDAQNLHNRASKLMREAIMARTKASVSAIGTILLGAATYASIEDLHRDEFYNGNVQTLMFAAVTGLSLFNTVRYATEGSASATVAVNLRTEAEKLNWQSPQSQTQPPLAQ